MNLPLNQIIQGDCLEVLKTFPDKSVDLVLTDPPYGMNLDTDFSGMESRLGGFKGKLRGGKYDKVEGDKTPFDFMPFWGEIKRVSKNGCIVFGCDYFIPRDIFLLGSMSIWDKRLTESADKMFGSCFETIWFYPKKKRTIYRYKWAGIFGMEKEQRSDRLHPTQKPEQFIRQLVLENSGSGDIILDPFLGSGTTAVAAKMENRNYIGIEISEKYCEIARQRVASAPTPLFTN